MNSETSFLTPPVFNGENYQAWAIRMMVHLDVMDLLEVVEQDYEVTPLGDNPTVNQMKHHKENTTSKAKAKACLFSAISPSILTRIMQMKFARMNESETIKDYADQLVDLENKVRLFGNDFADERIVQKILVILHEKCDATISSLENSKDLSSVTLEEPVKALPDDKCNKCGQLGHVERVCKSKPQQEEAKATINQYQEEQLFVATCFASKSTSESWLIDSVCTNHMTSDQELFKDLDRSKLKIGNGEYLDVRGKRTVAIQSHTGLKLIVDVLFVPDLDKNLLSVGQVLENGLKVLFEEKAYVITDADNKEMFKVKMRGKSFALNLLVEEQATIIKLENNPELLHKRLEHFHHDAILFMKENQLAEGLPSLEKNLSACEAY
ncbi:uncharacterized protein LOC125839146 [Solanum verrucosum]|uniref:uncharacterized protein LOC125839146 n=1 Tax=Solanum verrucosum TaxID=315347 RepID=UPI0020D00BAC|nr:uncharacterized protein LOC125839146 [Solanum verrucosum]